MSLILRGNPGGRIRSPNNITADFIGQSVFALSFHLRVDGTGSTGVTGRIGSQNGSAFVIRGASVTTGQRQFSFSITTTGGSWGQNVWLPANADLFMTVVYDGTDFIGYKNQAEIFNLPLTGTITGSSSWWDLQGSVDTGEDWTIGYCYSWTGTAPTLTELLEFAGAEKTIGQMSVAPNFLNVDLVSQTGDEGSISSFTESANGYNFTDLADQFDANTDTPLFVPPTITDCFLDPSGYIIICDLDAVPDESFSGSSATVNLGAGNFSIPTANIIKQAELNRAYFLIPEANFVSNVTSCTVDFPLDTIRTSAGDSYAAFSQVLSAENIYRETIPVSHPEKIGLNANWYHPRRFGGCFDFQNISRHCELYWKSNQTTGTYPSVTAISLPTTSPVGNQDDRWWTYALESILPSDTYWLMWEGDTSVTFDIYQATLLEGPTISGNKKYVKYQASGNPRRIDLRVDSDCSSITKFVFCTDEDWDPVGLDTKGVLSRKCLDRYKGVTSIRPFDDIKVNTGLSWKSTMITPAAYGMARGQNVTETLTVTAIEDYTNEPAYLADGDFFGVYNQQNLGTVIKVTCSGGIGNFRTGDKAVLSSGNTGSIRGWTDLTFFALNFNPIYVPDGVTTYFYQLSTEGTNGGAPVDDFTISAVDTVSVSRGYGMSPEMIAEFCNAVYEEWGDLQYLHYNFVHHTEDAKFTAVASRLNAVLNASIKVAVSIGNEWVFNFGEPFRWGYYYFRWMPRVTAFGTVWDFAANRYSQAKSLCSAQLGAGRVEMWIEGQTFDAQAYSNITNSSEMIETPDAISGTNYMYFLGISPRTYRWLSASAWCTIVSEDIRLLEQGAWLQLSNMGTTLGLPVINYEGGDHAVASETNSGNCRYKKMSPRYWLVMRHSQKVCAKLGITPSAFHMDGSPNGAGSNFHTYAWEHYPVNTIAGPGEPALLAQVESGAITDSQFYTSVTYSPTGRALQEFINFQPKPDYRPSTRGGTQNMRGTI